MSKYYENFPYKSTYKSLSTSEQSFVNNVMCSMEMFVFSGITAFNINIVFTYKGTAIYYRHVFFENWHFTNTFQG